MNKEVLSNLRNEEAEEFEKYLIKGGVPGLIVEQMIKAFHEGFSICAEILVPLIEKQQKEEKE